MQLRIQMSQIFHSWILHKKMLDHTSLHKQHGGGAAGGNRMCHGWLLCAGHLMQSHLPYSIGLGSVIMDGFEMLICPRRPEGSVSVNNAASALCAPRNSPSSATGLAELKGEHKGFQYINVYKQRRYFIYICVTVVPHISLCSVLFTETVQGGAFSHISEAKPKLCFVLPLTRSFLLLQGILNLCQTFP